jgi:alanine racemase
VHRQGFRPAWAEVDLAAVRANARALAALAAPARLCAVVKADGYGHGAVPVARAALEGGATCLAVALVEEGAALRDAGIEAPVLMLSEPPVEAMDEVVARRLTPTLYTLPGAHALARAAAAAAPGEPVAVHVKVDTGMHRVGATVEDAVRVGLAVAAAPYLRLEGLWTHFAVADEPERDFTAQQCARLDGARRCFAAAGLVPAVVHAANSAGAIAHARSRYDLVRCGISLYGYALGPAPDVVADLRPALSLKACVSFVRTLPAGEAVSYGLRYRLDGPSIVATVPLGYADGVPWRLSSVGGEVLVGGRRRPIAGTVTMDQIMVDCGPGAAVATGDEVVLLGEQGDERITADEWAGALGTITYEVLCGIGPRVPRVYR